MIVVVDVLILELDYVDESIMGFKLQTKRDVKHAEVFLLLLWKLVLPQTQPRSNNLSAIYLPWKM